MRSVISTIWRYKFIFLILLVLVGVWIFYQSQKGSKVTTKPPEQAVSYKSLTPGKSNLDQLEKEFGEPLETKEDGTKKTLDFQSSSKVRPNQAIVEDETVVFIKEIVTKTDEKSVKNITGVYGDPNFVLYDQSSPNSSFSLYVYPDRGLAFIGHPSGTLLEIWYFPPTTLDDFIQRWAPNYSQAKPKPIQ